MKLIEFEFMNVHELLLYNNVFYTIYYNIWTSH
jgi:hypothetical protein